MTVAPLAVLATAVAAMKASKSKDCKAILIDLAEDHPEIMAEASALADTIPEAADSELGAAGFLACCVAMGVRRRDIKAGAEPCIVDGRYAVRTKDGGLKVGPLAG